MTDDWREHETHLMPGLYSTAEVCAWLGLPATEANQEWVVKVAKVVERQTTECGIATERTWHNEGPAAGREGI